MKNSAEKPRRRLKKGTVSALQDLAIVLLLVLGVALSAAGGLLPADVVAGWLAGKAQSGEEADEGYAPAAAPYCIVLTPEDGAHCAVMYSGEELAETYGRFSAMLGEAPGTPVAAEPDPESAELLRRRPRPFRKPDIRGLDRALTAAEKGTAAHLALRYLELGGLSSPEDVRGRLQALVEQGRISAREAASVDAVSILRLAQSELGRKIAAAPRLLREFPFALLCPAGRFFEGAEGEELLLQGVVDCCIIEDDGLTVIDYKTDRIRPGQEPQRAELYRSQLEAYSWAMSRITGLPVKDRYLLFLATGTALAL